MNKTALPPTEAFRLIDLSTYKIMDTDPEDDFDDIVELAAQICNTPISLITLLDDKRQWFKAKRGVDETESTRDVSFCSHAILQDEVMVVEDATKDHRFFDNPFVTGEMNIRFYAGAPIISPTGYKLGTVCILDKQPRRLSAEQARALTILSNQVSRLLEQRKNNWLVWDRSQKIISLKSGLIQNMIEAQEADKKLLAINVHEDLAQGVASSIFYIQAAQEDKTQRDTSLITAKKQLQDILIKMQELSYSIIPNTQDLLPAKDMVIGHVQKIANSFPFTLSVRNGSNVSNGNADHAIIVVRILDQWLKTLAAKKTVSAVFITVQPNDQFEVIIEDNAPEENGHVIEKEIIQSLVYDRARAMGGTVEWYGSTGRNLLKVRLPV